MSGLDCFYTQPQFAQQYATAVMARWCGKGVLFVEPSAGAGAFTAPLRAANRKTRAMDIAPATAGIAQADFLHTQKWAAGRHTAVVVVGNPPFGKNASTAVRFFNHAAQYADAIAFIVPKTFRKMSVQARLHRHFHLAHDESVPPRAFLLQGKPYDVPCAWQIWEKRAGERALPQVPCVAHLIQYTAAREATFAMRRVGFYAGRVCTQNLSTLSATTHYFMREVQSGVLDVLRNINWCEVAAQTAGVRSLSKGEIALKLNASYIVK